MLLRIQCVLRKGCKIHVSNDTTPWERRNSAGRKVTGFGGVVVNRWHKRDSQDHETVLYDSTVVATHDTFVKTRRTCTTKSKPSYVDLV